MEWNGNNMTNVNVMENNTSTTRKIDIALIATYVLLAAAIGVSGYLSWLKVSGSDAVCVAGGAFDCGTVLNSRYSELFGIPIAWLGLATNLVVLTLLVLQNRVAFLQESGTLLIFGVLLFAFIYSVYLVYVQAFLIQAYCPWCLSHEALITVLFGIWTWKAVRVLNEEA